MTKILITGVNSFVGRNFIHHSNNINIDEISLFENKPADINFTAYDVVIHLVAIVHQSKQIKEDEYFKINRNLCAEVADYAKKAGVKHFVFLSTIKVFGKFIPSSVPWNESSDCFPEDAYGKSKYEAEIYLKKLIDENFSVSIIRTPLVYGEGVQANMYSILRLIDSFPVLPFKNVKNKRNFTSVENLTAFIDRIIEMRISGVFIAMDEKPLSTTDLVNLISRHLNKRVFLFKMPKLIVEAGKYLIPKIFDRLYGSFEMDNSKTLKELNFKAPVSTEEGIEKMVIAYKLNKSRIIGSAKN